MRQALYKHITKYQFKVIFKYIKVLVSIGLCVLLVSCAEWTEVFFSLTKANIIILAFVLFLMFLNVLISSIKWKILLDIQNYRISLLRLFRYYLIANFFNNFLPSTIGGDTYRIYKICKGNQNRKQLASTVFFERIYGLFILIVMGTICGILSYYNYPRLITQLCLLFGVISIAIFVLVNIMFIYISDNVTQVKYNMVHKISKVYKFMNLSYFNHKKQIIYFLIMSVIFCLILFICRFLIILSFGSICYLFDIGMVSMVSNIVATFPLSINGIGLLDSSYVYMLNQYCINYDIALVAILFERLLTILISLVGGILYIFEDKDNISSMQYANPNIGHNLKG